MQPPQPCQNPYEELHIYYLEGRVQSGDEFFGGHFIGNWEEDGHAFLFFSKPALQIVERLIADEPQLTLLDQFQMSYDDWHGGPITPLSVGRIEVVPPWSERGTAPAPFLETGPGQLTAKYRVLLDPGVVFGTGTHPTTYACIEALDLVSRLSVPETVLDIGTGTGLLAIAAVKLGCQRVLALDLNLLAARTTRRNVLLNEMEEQVLVVQGDAENFMDFPRDVVISNIHYDVMKRLIQRQGFLTGGFFILSGLLRSQAVKIEQMLNSYPVEIIKKWGADGVWQTYLGYAA
jgi:ribosomal protein L11 methyltransferase